MNTTTRVLLSLFLVLGSLAACAPVYVDHHGGALKGEALAKPSAGLPRT